MVAQGVCMIKTGRKEKDALIKEGFNPDKQGVLSRSELAKARKQAKIDKAVAELERQKKERALERLSDQIGVLKEKVSAAAPPARPSKPEVVDATEGPDDDAKSAYQMLEHLRYAYRNSKSDTGRKGKMRLVELMEKDAEFKFMIRELVKVEASLLASKIKAKEGPDSIANNMVFVVLKGLEEEKQVMKQIEGVDMKQVTDALNPDAVKYEADEEEQHQIAGQAAPEGW